MINLTAKEFLYKYLEEIMIDLYYDVENLENKNEINKIVIYNIIDTLFEENKINFILDGKEIKKTTNLSNIKIEKNSNIFIKVDNIDKAGDGVDFDILIDVLNKYGYSSEKVLVENKGRRKKYVLNSILKIENVLAFKKTIKDINNSVVEQLKGFYEQKIAASKKSLDFLNTIDPHKFNSIKKLLNRLNMLSLENEEAKNILETIKNTIKNDIDTKTGCYNADFFLNYISGLKTERINEDESIRQNYFRFISYVKNTYKDNNPVLINLDLGRFKSINDEYSHSLGDEALKIFVEMIRKNISEQAIFTRNGGDEFSILTNQKDANNLLKLVKSPEFLLEYNKKIGEAWDKLYPELEKKELEKPLNKRIEYPEKYSLGAYIGAAYTILNKTKFDFIDKEYKSLKKINILQDGKININDLEKLEKYKNKYLEEGIIKNNEFKKNVFTLLKIDNENDIFTQIKELEKDGNILSDSEIKTLKTLIELIITRIENVLLKEKDSEIKKALSNEKDIKKFKEEVVEEMNKAGYSEYKLSTRGKEIDDEVMEVDDNGLNR